MGLTLAGSKPASISAHRTSARSWVQRALGSGRSEPGGAQTPSKSLVAHTPRLPVHPGRFTSTICCRLSVSTTTMTLTRSVLACLDTHFMYSHVNVHFPCIIFETQSKWQTFKVQVTWIRFLIRTGCMKAIYAC